MALGRTIGAKLTLYPPQDAAAPHTIQSPQLRYDASLNETARLSFEIRDNWLKEHYSLFFIENGSPSALHPAQVKGYATYEENGTYILRGPVVGITIELMGGVPVFVVTVEDRTRILKDTLASYTENSQTFYTFKRETGAVDAGSAAGFPGTQTRVRLYPETYVAGSQRWKYFPKYDANAWLPTSVTDALGQLDDLAANITNASTEIPAGASYKGFRPAGFIFIGSEAIQYDGYTYDQANTRWTFNNCKRGMLGSTAAAHTAGDDIHALVPKRIHAGEPILIEGYDGATYEALPQDGELSRYTKFGVQTRSYEWSVNPEEGAFVFHQEPLQIGVRDAGGTAYTSLWATYGVYDEDDANSTQLTLQEVVEGLLQQPVSVLGPGFEDTNAGDGLELCTVQATADIPISTLIVERPTYCWEVLRQLLSDLGLNRGSDKDVIVIRDVADTGSGTGALQVRALAQAATPDYYFHGAEMRSETFELATVKSAFLVRSTGNQDMNLLGTPRYRHTLAEISAPASTKPYVFHKARNTSSGVSAAWADKGTNYGGTTRSHALNNGWPSAVKLAQLMTSTDSYPNLIFDNNPDTGFGLYWTSQANCQSTTNKQNELYFWFPGSSDTAPDLYQLDSFILALDCWGKSDSTTTRQLDISIYAMTAFTDGAPPTRTLKGLGTNSRFIMSPGTFGTNNTDGVQTIELDGDGQLCYGICIVINRGQIPLDASIAADGTVYGISILDIAAFGTPYAYNAVKLKASYNAADKGDSLTAVTTAAKLLDQSLGNHTVGLMDVGPCSRAVALNLGVLQLLTNLAVSQERTYTIRSIGMDALDTSGKPHFPLIGETWQCVDDGFAGVVTGINYVVDNRGQRSLTLRLVNYNTSLYGTGAN